MQGTVNFTGSEHWPLFIFVRAQPWVLFEFVLACHLCSCGSVFVCTI